MSGGKLTKAQRAMLFNAARQSEHSHGVLPRWKVAVTAPQFRTLACLERIGLLAVEYGALGTTPYVRLTPAARGTLQGQGE